MDRDKHIDPKRSALMARIRAKDTHPELTIRSLLHRRGFRFRIHDRRLPGSPDIILPKHRAVLFVNGCFWHMHDCHYFRLPKTRSQFWLKKLQSNKERDAQKITRLLQEGWRVATIWECSVRDRTTEEIGVMMEKLSEWILRSEVSASASPPESAEFA